MPDPVGAECVERAAHGRRPGGLAGVRNRAEAEGARERERRLVRLGRILGLEPAEPDRDDSAVAVLGRVADDLLRLLGRRSAKDVRRQPHLDAVQLARLLGAVAVAAEDLVPVESPRDALGRAEDRLEVDRAVRGGLGGVVRHHLPEVGGGLQRVGREDPDLDEVREVAEAVERLEVVGQRVVVALRDRAQRVRRAPSPRGGRAARSSVQAQACAKKRRNCGVKAFHKAASWPPGLRWARTPASRA